MKNVLVIEGPRVSGITFDITVYYKFYQLLQQSIFYQPLPIQDAYLYNKDMNYVPPFSVLAFDCYKTVTINILWNKI